MKEENKKFLLIVLTTLLVCVVSVLCFRLGMKFADKENKLNPNPKEQVTPHDNNEENDSEEIDDYSIPDIIKLNNLNETINKLDFTNKTVSQDHDDEYYVKAEIKDNKLIISYKVENHDEQFNKLDPVELTYTSDKIKDPISVLCFYSEQGNGGDIIYVLTKDKKVYTTTWEDFNDVRNNNMNNLGLFKLMTGENIESIAPENNVITTAMGREVMRGSIDIVIKTTGGKYYTNLGEFSEANPFGLVEITNK